MTNFNKMITTLCFILAPLLSANALNRTVSVGGDIQAAIDAVAASGGGTVTLNAGTHILSASLYMKSNVTLTGKGSTNTIIQLPSNATYAMIKDDGTEPLTNMTVQNLQLDGNIPASKVSHDPDYTDPQGDCLGILFDADNEATYHTNVVIQNIEVKNTVDGIHLKGIDGGTIHNVYLHHNGVFFWPGHNMYLRRVFDVDVTNSQFLNAYNGAGINMSYNGQVNITECVSSDNDGRGFRSAISEGLLVQYCTVDGNGDVGILANKEQSTAVTDLNIRYNCVSNNGQDGIEALSGSTGVIRDNNSYNNSGDDYSYPSTVFTTSNGSNSSCGTSEDGSIVTMKKRNSSSYALDGGNGGSNGQALYLWTQNSSNINQQWVEIDKGSGYYSYRKLGTDYCMDGGNNGENKQEIYLWLCSSSNQNQQWEKVSAGSGNYRLIKRNSSSFSIDGNNNGANGQLVYLYSNSSSNQNQQWTFTTSTGARVLEDSGLDESVVESLELTDVIAYPNPVSYTLSVEFGDAEYNDITVYDISGQIMFNKHVEFGLNNMEIDFNAFAKGVYTVKLTKDNTTEVIKVVKD